MSWGKSFDESTFSRPGLRWLEEGDCVSGYPSQRRPVEYPGEQLAGRVDRLFVAGGWFALETSSVPLN
jgi:hypothetical protein